MCDDIRLGGDKCDNQIYGIQDFINSFQSYFDNGNKDASIIANSIINRLNSKLNNRASFLDNMSSILETKCLHYDYESDSEYLLPFKSLYFAGNDDRQANLPNDMQYNAAQNRQVSLSASTYKLPDDVNYKNKHVQRDAQVSELLDNTMKQLYDSYCKSDRIYPGSENSKTNDKYNNYDPRFRPWYVSSASGGGKDVLILIERSRYMSSSQMSLAKKSVTALLKTLGQSSFVNIVAFDSEIYLSCFGEQLVPATTRNIDQLLLFVEKLSRNLKKEWGNYVYKLDYKKAFNKAFDILLKSENKINCHTNILFFTQGGPCEDCASGFSYEPDPSGTIAKRNNDINAVVFSYVLGECKTTQDEDYCLDIPKNVAKKTGGVYSRIKSSSDIITKLSAYFLYYSYGSEGRNIIVTSPYLDFDTKTIMITMTKSVYIDEKYFVGVVGTDIPLTFLADAIGDITVGAKSYSFVMNDASELLLHPAIADDSALFGGNIGNDRK
eukprot:151053_1